MSVGLFKAPGLGAKVKYLKYQWKRLWIEYPEIAFAAGLGLFAAAVGYNKAQYVQRHPNLMIKPYKERYTIYRPEDPRSYRVRCTPDLPPDDPHIVKI